MGRPPTGARAMTAAEKQRAYRQRKFGNKPPVTKSRADADLAGLRVEIERLRDEVERWKRKADKRLARAFRIADQIKDMIVKTAR
jgi:hypothetical protein